MSEPFEMCAEPEPPRPGQIGYLEWLAGLDYPPGYAFWSLAPPIRGVEAVWVIDQDGGHKIMAVDRNAGEVRS